MKETPILFKGEMVRAILEERKTQTRRVVKFGTVGRKMVGDQKLWPYVYYAGSSADGHVWTHAESGQPSKAVPCPYGQPGDRLWVREMWLSRAQGEATLYRADYDSTEAAGIAGMYGGWKPSIHMHHWRSRISLELTAVRVERVQDISVKDALAEGVFHDGKYSEEKGLPYPVATYKTLWDSINGKKHSWASNPWVWVLTFKRIQNAKL